MPGYSRLRHRPRRRRRRHRSEVLRLENLDTDLPPPPGVQVVITCSDGDGLVDALLATTDSGDEVIVTDPVYAGMINRVRSAGAVPSLVPLSVVDGAGASISKRCEAR
jgi:aspartate/methionine/tyrosine aminotransferase